MSGAQSKIIGDGSIGPDSVDDAVAVSSKSRFRPDVEGLRAIAVGLVVLFHAGFPWFPGGYVGVDVFFVISGFLITGLLIREVQRTGRLSIKDFYVRRIRRILPMSTLVLVMTVICAALWMTGTESAAASIAASWAALFVANWYFAASASDYFDTSTQTNPILHYWSLGVEEQFYVIWPLLLIVAILIAKWRGASVKSLLRGALVGLLILCAVSLWWSATKTGEEGQWAFFGLHTRLWELGFGGLLAYALPKLGQIPRAAAQVMAAVGVVLIVYAAVMFTELTVFPGTAALAPVVGAMLLIAAGSSDKVTVSRPTLVGRVLATKPMQYLGARSYNLYLWHWPVLVFAAMWSSPRTFGGSDTSHLTMPALVAVVAIAIALVFTSVTFRFIEQPLRHSLMLKQARTAFPLALGMIVLVLITTLFVSPAVVGAKESRLEPARLELVAQAEEISDELQTNKFWRKRTSCLDPVKGSTSQVMNRWNEEACTFGDPNGQTKIALVGDSHADMWLPALDKYGKATGSQITYIAKSACSIYEVANYPTDSQESVCSEWAHAALEELKNLGPFDAVLIGRRAANLTGRSTVGANASTKDGVNTFVEDIHNTFEQLATVTKKIIILQDPSTTGFDVPACIERAQGDASQCEFGRAEGLKAELVVQADEREAAKGLPTGVTVEEINTAPILCPENLTSCPAVIETQEGNLIVFRDTHHVPYGTSRALVDQLQPMLNKAIN
ncbi:MAG: acyltransferase family protein [Candidatus Nanopelagicales bacterium]